jgi:transcriptional regulator with XRE-family HTH domain
MSINQKIKQLIDKENLSISAFEKKIGAGNNSIGTLLNKNSNISGVVLSKILEAYPNLSLDWFFKDEGEMFAKPKFYKIDEEELMIAKEEPSAYVLDTKQTKKKIHEIKVILTNYYYNSLELDKNSKDYQDLKRMIELEEQVLEVLQSRIESVNKVKS